MESAYTLSRNAQLFYIGRELQKEEVENILNSATADSESASTVVPDEFRLAPAHGKFKYSSRTFSRTAAPHFHNSPELLDLQYGYIVLIEYGHHLGVLRLRGEDTSDHLESKFELIGIEEIKLIFDEPNSEFQKLNVRNMTISERALRARSYEALDLKGLLSLHSAGRSIPSYFRVKEGGVTKSFTIGSGRITEASERASIEKIGEWILLIVDRLKNAKAAKGFLDNFAKIVDLVDVLSKTTPRSILIESSSIKEKMEDGSLKLSILLKNGKEADLSKMRPSAVLSILDKVYEFDNNGKVVGHEGTDWLKSPSTLKHQKTLTFHSRALRRVVVDDGSGKRKNLLSYIIQNGLFSICFDDPKYMYFSNKCFLDSTGTTEIETLLKIFVQMPALALATCEKGSEVKGALKGATSFPATSVFGIVEAAHAGDDFIFCDDLGDEWADHITFNQASGSINFIHSKHKTTTTSASAFQDVTSQALKNLGNMHFDSATFKAKHARSLISKKYPNSDISRVRKKTGNLPQFTAKLLSNYSIDRYAILACSFVSHAKTTSALLSLKKTGKAPGHIIQLYWLISSFAHACRDIGVIPKIYCSP